MLFLRSYRMNGRISPISFRKHKFGNSIYMPDGSIRGFLYQDTIIRRLVEGILTKKGLVLSKIQIKRDSHGLIGIGFLFSNPSSLSPDSLQSAYSLVHVSLLRFFPSSRFVLSGRQVLPHVDVDLALKSAQSKIRISPLKPFVLRHRILPSTLRSPSSPLPPIFSLDYSLSRSLRLPLSSSPSLRPSLFLRRSFLLHLLSYRSLLDPSPLLSKTLTRSSLLTQKKHRLILLSLQRLALLLDPSPLSPSPLVLSLLVFHHAYSSRLRYPARLRIASTSLPSSSLSPLLLSLSLHSSPLTPLSSHTLRPLLSSLSSSSL